MTSGEALSGRYAPVPSREPPDRRPGVAFWVLAAAVFVQANGLGAIFPLLARIQQAHHLPTWGLGLMSGASFLATFAAQVRLRGVLDGPRARPVLLIGLALATAGPLWFSVAGSLGSLTAARALSGAGYAILMPAALRCAGQGSAGALRGRRLGLVSSAQMAGIVTGPLVGTGLYELAGLAAPFQAVAGASAAVMVGALLLPSVGTAGVAGAGSKMPGDQLTGPEVAGNPARPRLGSPAVVALLALAVASQIPNGLYDSLWSRLLTDRGASTGLIGLSLAIYGVPFMLLAPLGGRLAARRSPLPWAVAGLGASSVFLLLYGLIHQVPVILVMGVLEACAQAVAVPGGFAAVASAFPQRWAATGQAWYSAAGTAAAGVSSVAGAALYGGFGPGVVFSAGAIACGAFLVAAYRIWARGQKAERPARLACRSC